MGWLRYDRFRSRLFTQHRAEKGGGPGSLALVHRQNSGFLERQGLCEGLLRERWPQSALRGLAHEAAHLLVGRIRSLPEAHERGSGPILGDCFSSLAAARPAPVNTLANAQSRNVLCAQSSALKYRCPTLLACCINGHVAGASNFLSHPESRPPRERRPEGQRSYGLPRSRPCQRTQDRADLLLGPTPLALRPGRGRDRLF